MRNLHHELETWDGYPDAWRPEPGEILVGVVVEYDQGHTAYGPVRTVIIAGEDGRRVSLWLSSTVLLQLFQRHQPKPGERIGLKYLGKDPDKGYHRYRLLVDRPVTLELSPLGGEDEADGAEAEGIDAPC